MPIHDHLLFADLQTALDYEIDDFREVLFGGWNVSWVYIFAFEGSEVQFAGSYVIRVWTLEQNRYFQLLQQLQGPCCRMVWSSIHSDYGVLPPRGPLLI